MKSWFMSIVGSAMLVVFSELLLEKSSQKAVGRLAGTLVMLLMVLRPLVSVGDRPLGDLADEIGLRSGQQEQHLRQESLGIYKQIIEAQFQAYILDRVPELDGTGEVRVCCELTEEGVWTPSVVELSARVGQEERSEVERVVKDELGVQVVIAADEGGGVG